MIWSKTKIIWFKIRFKILYFVDYVLFLTYTKMRYGILERIINQDAYCCRNCTSRIAGRVIRQNKYTHCPVCGVEI